MDKYQAFTSYYQLMKDVNYFAQSILYKVHLRYGSNICKIPVNYWDCGKRSWNRSHVLRKMYNVAVIFQSANEWFITDINQHMFHYFSLVSMVSNWMDGIQICISCFVSMMKLQDKRYYHALRIIDHGLLTIQLFEFF